MDHVVAVTEAYQAQNGLAVDGKLGPNTRRHIDRRELSPMPFRFWPLAAIGTGRYPQVTSGARWRNPSRPTHNGVDLMYSYLAGDPPVTVGSGGASGGTDGTAKWWAPDPTVVISSAAGIVRQASSTPTGARVWIQHMSDAGHLTPWYTGYFHLADFDVLVGDLVNSGEAIGSVGSDPAGGARHLHYEVYYGDLGRYPDGAVDPELWLERATRDV